MLLLVPTPTRKVKRQARVLDRIKPGWEKKIEPEKLNLHSWGNCVLGQVYGDYGTGVNELGDKAGLAEIFFDNDPYREVWLKAVEQRLAPPRGLRRLVTRNSG
jgi:hypothetical protein